MAQEIGSCRLLGTTRGKLVWNQNVVHRLKQGAVVSSSGDLTTQIPKHGKVYDGKLAYLINNPYVNFPPGNRRGKLSNLF